MVDGLNMVSRTALCDQRRRLDKSSGIICRLSLSFAQSRNTKIQNVQ